MTGSAIALLLLVILSAFALGALITYVLEEMHYGGHK